MTGLSLTPETLSRGLPAEIVARGKSYAEDDRVSQLQYFPARHRYTAEVQGTHARPYQVEAQLIQGAVSTKIYGLCTCPARVNCKHVAAMLWAAIDGRVVEKSAETKLPSANTQGAVSVLTGDVPPELSNWLDRAQRLVQLTGENARPAVENPQRLLYVLCTAQRSALSLPSLKLFSARKLKGGGVGLPTPWNNLRQALVAPPRFITAADQRIFRMLLLDSLSDSWGAFSLQGETGADILRAVLATGRCHSVNTDSPPLRESAARRGKAVWAFSDTGVQRIAFDVEPVAQWVLPFSTPWYVDSVTGECGPLECGLPASVVALLAQAPAIAPQHAALARAALAATTQADATPSGAAHAVALPVPAIPPRVDKRNVVPSPCLRLSTLQVIENRYGRRQWRDEYLDIAALEFDYAGVRANRDSPGILSSFSDGSVLQIKRNAAAEKRAHAALTGIGFAQIKRVAPDFPREHQHDYTLRTEQAWHNFMARQLPPLRAQGWQIEVTESFRFAVAEAGEWRAAITESGNDWFDLSLDVDVEGTRVDLIPLLLTVIRDHPGLLRPSTTATTDSDAYLFVRLDNGRLMPVPLARMQPLAQVLHDLLDTAPAGKIRVPRVDAMRLADLDEASELRWQGGEALRALARKLAGFKALTPLPAPTGFGAQLRPYQEQGLAWLQFLREYGLGGILADDMGLGKTVQTLAHILVEKRAGRLLSPVLVVAPTSVVPNWKVEAARFAPQLRVHVSHGLKRKEFFSEIGAFDLVLTTYALLPRDEETLLAQEFHLVILDEAQQIKNARTQAARVVGKLRAHHRLCLTGTPLENHLGELWSLFHFLMPGLLGDATGFRRAYRTPIEKHGDGARRENLVRRMRPFLLRRTKDQVASELPLKSEILRPVELQGAQRELYETVRASMHERVRAEISARGLAQSHIIVLDALLKLRQICCDPRLLKISAAKQVKESAKLQLLLEMLQELLPEGRRVLIFSQFTSMLELIEPELAKLGIAHVKLTGQTRDRERPVKSFQSGDVPLFLISLKAGGTGLNLTAADTVIHYDPWWNPAVENQATGRAHRIGQDKPVFVYKLIVAGSVEEKIAALQASKAMLARSVLENDAGATPALTADDIQALFEPLR